MRKRIYEIIEVSKNGDFGSSVYDYFMIALITASLFPLAFKNSTPTLIIIDYVAVIVFIIDYILRLITADFKYGKKSALSFIRYPFGFYAIIDVISILPSFIFINNGFRLLRLSRMMRAFRVFRVFKALRYSKSMAIIIEVFRKQKSALMAVVTLAAGYIFVCALVIFNVEPESFSTFFNAIYWAAVSLTTMGYGDIYPITPAGQLVTVISSIVGIAIIALPAGIITAGYIGEISEKKEDDETN